jgi:hypothetical protein
VLFSKLQLTLLIDTGKRINSVLNESNQAQNFTKLFWNFSIAFLSVPTASKSLPFSPLFLYSFLLTFSHVRVACHMFKIPHAATYCVIIQTQRTQIIGRNSNGTKHSGGPPEDGRENRPKHVGVLYLQTRF